MPSISLQSGRSQPQLNLSLQRSPANRANLSPNHSLPNLQNNSNNNSQFPGFD